MIKRYKFHFYWRLYSIIEHKQVEYKIILNQLCGRDKKGILVFPLWLTNSDEASKHKQRQYSWNSKLENLTL